MSLKDIEKELYGREEEPEKDDFLVDLSKPKIDPEKTKWERNKPIGKVKKKEAKKRQTDFYQKKKKPYFLYGLIFILVIVLGWLGLAVAQKFTQGDKGVEMSFNTPEEILIFDPFDLEVEFENNSQNLLQGSTLILELPDNFRSMDGENSNILKREIGDLGTDLKKSETFRLLTLGEPNRVAKFKAYLQYNIPGFTTRFEKLEEIDLDVSGFALGLNLSLPEKTLSGEEFTFTINYFNNTTKNIFGFKIKTAYPLGFEFLGSNLPIESDEKNEWSLGDLGPREEGKLEIRGKISGNPNSFFEFKSGISIFSGEKFFDLGEKTAGLTILDSPLRLMIKSDSDNGIVSPGETVRYTVSYQNNTEITLEEVIIKLSLEGEMFDLSSIDTKGYLDSGTRRVIWNAGNTPELRLINKGGQGEVSFSTLVSSNYPIRSIDDKDFTLKVRAQLESTSVPIGIDKSETTAQAQLETRVAGQFNLLPKVLFRDAPSGIVNKGLLPLTVGKATNFTVHWKLVNYANDLKDVVLRAVLPQGVTWTGQLAGNYDNEPTYNDRTGEVEWKISQLPANTGVISKAKELIFQIAVMPSVNQVGQNIPIISSTNVSATNDFTGQKISFSVDELTSDLKDDPTTSSEDGIVKP